MNYYTLLDVPNEKQTLDVHFEMMKNSTTVDMTPRNLGGDGDLYVDEEYLPFWWFNENIYYNI